jgi:hypothetical protein
MLFSSFVFSPSKLEANVIGVKLRVCDEKVGRVRKSNTDRQEQRATPACEQ